MVEENFEYTVPKWSRVGLIRFQKEVFNLFEKYFKFCRAKIVQSPGFIPVFEKKSLPWLKKIRDVFRWFRLKILTSS